MNIKINNIRFATMAAALFCLGLASCSDDFGRYGGANGEKIKVTVPDFKMGEGFEDLQTRTAVDLSNKQYITSWTEGDYIDVFALSGQFEGTAASSSHVKFEITDIAEGNEAHARFQGDGYGLVEGYEYAAYYPYKTGNDYPSNAVELSYDYSGTTITPDATDHIADFDYLVAKPQIPENQKVTLNFEHVGTLVRLRVYCPNAGTYNKIQILSPDKDAFVKTATLNVSDGTTTITETTNTMEFPITPTEVSENGTVTIYFMVHPNNYKSKLLTVYIEGSTSWMGTVVGKDFAKGNAESLNVVANKIGINSQGHEYVDLGLPSGTLWATMNVGATEVVGTKINPVTGALDYYGQHYCFGETNGYNEAPTAYPADWTGSTNSSYLSLETKKSYGTANYKWQNTGKYSSYSDELLPEDDAATVNWGGDWRTPTYGEIIELKENCVFIKVSSYMGVSANGFIVYLAKEPSDRGKVITDSSSPNGSYSIKDPHIFLPIGCGLDNNFGITVSFFMSSSTTYDYTHNASGLYVGSSVTANATGQVPPREYGISVRPVLKGKVSNIYDNSLDYVDLGLSVKWAKKNVGATEVAGKKKNSHTGILDCYGEYYAWGETEPKDEYYNDTYKWYQPSTIGFPYNYTKYTLADGSTYGSWYNNGTYVGSTIDGVTYKNLGTLLPEDDAATANLGEAWRTPTKNEMEELVNNCYLEWTDGYVNSGVAGFVVYKAKNDGDKGKIKTSSSTPSLSSAYSLTDAHIFLPLSGQKQNEIYDRNIVGYYLTNSISATPAVNYIRLEKDRYGFPNTPYRSYGYSVRPVHP